MKILTKGPTNLKELADWFGISYSYMRKAKGKERKLKELQYFCDYHIDEKGHIYIDEVYFETYSSKQEIKLKWAQDELYLMAKETGKITCVLASHNVMDEQHLYPLVPKEGINKETKLPYTLQETKRLALESFSNGITSKAFKEMFGTGIDKETGEVTQGSLGWFEVIECSAASNGLCCYDFEPLTKEDKAYLNVLRSRNQTAPETGAFIEDIVDEDKQQKILDKVNNYKENIYYKNVIKPMNDYLTKEYGEYRCYVKARLIHFNDEET